MLGVVLSGGESRRMGTDKGLLLAENESWVQNAYSKLSSLVAEVVISINPSQLQEYASQFQAGQLLADNAGLSVKGPLHGLLSVHLQFPGEDLFVLACDMVAMDNKALEHLLHAYRNHPGKDCYVFKNDNGYQPLAGIYTASLLSNILQQIEHGQLHKFSMKHVLDFADTHVLTVPETWNKYFVNYNYKEDIDFQ